jgi:hypothetical protein
VQFALSALQNKKQYPIPAATVAPLHTQFFYNAYSAFWQQRFAVLKYKIQCAKTQQLLNAA